MAEELDIGALYEQHGGFMGRVIERLTGDGSQVDDLLQETFIVAYRKRKKYDPKRAAVTTWLYGIAANLCRHHLRSQRRLALFRAKAMHQPEPAGPARPDQELERTQRVRLVYDVLETLPFKQREVFALYELENLDGATIANMLGIPEGTVWTRLHHARRGFADRLKRRQARGEA